MDDKVTCGLIGVGGISQSQHLPNLSRARHVRLKTVCDLREDVLGQMRRKYAVPEATTDHRQLLADPEIELIVVATQPAGHVAMTVEAL